MKFNLSYAGLRLVLIISLSCLGPAQSQKFKDNGTGLTCANNPNKPFAFCGLAGKNNQGFGTISRPGAPGSDTNFGCRDANFKRPRCCPALAGVSSDRASQRQARIAQNSNNGCETPN